MFDIINTIRRIDPGMENARAKLIDFFVVNGANVALYAYLTRKNSTVQRVLARFASLRPTASRTWLDVAIASGLSLTFAASAHYKMNITEPRRGSTHARFQLLWLLQPCYISLGMVLFVVLFPRSRHNARVFALLCSWVWGAVASFLFPDRDGYTQPLELENYFLQHYLILLTPLLYLACRRTSAYAHMSWREAATMTLYGDVIHNLYHFLFLWTVSMLSDVNLNYMLSPPSKIPAFVRESPHYRLIISAATTLLAAPITGVLVPKLITLLPPLPLLSYAIPSAP